MSPNDVPERCDLILRHGIPWVVLQALDDMSLPPSCQRLMWKLGQRLDVMEFREVKLASIAADVRCKPSSASEFLTLLVGRGYLDKRRIERQAMAFRLPISRRQGRTL